MMWNHRGLECCDTKLGWFGVTSYASAPTVTSGPQAPGTAAPPAPAAVPRGFWANLFGSATTVLATQEQTRQANAAAKIAEAQARAAAASQQVIVQETLPGWVLPAALVSGLALVAVVILKK